MRPASVQAQPSGPPDRDPLWALRHSRHRVAAGRVMILLPRQGKPAMRVAVLFGYQLVTVRRWMHRYNHEGISALADRPRPPWPSSATPPTVRRMNPPQRPVQGTVNLGGLRRSLAGAAFLNAGSGLSSKAPRISVP